jgi:hypothetical protein
MNNSTRHIRYLLLAAVLGAPSGILIAIILTPLWWKLEPVLHLELAGHSGPADWLLIAVAILCTVALYFFLIFLNKNKL